jgi:hypothetical protein
LNIPVFKEPPKKKPGKLRLFDENDYYLDDAFALDIEASNTMTEMVNRWCNTHSIRDVGVILHQVVDHLTQMVIFTRGKPGKGEEPAKKKKQQD